MSFFTPVSYSNSVILVDGSRTLTQGIGRKQNGLYELKLASDQAACMSTSAFEYHCRLGHPSLPELKFLVPSLGRVSSLECESRQ